MKQIVTELLKHSSIYFIGTISEKAVLVFFLPVLTTYLSPEQFGIVALSQIAVDMFERFTTPFSSALNRFYYNPEYEENRSILLWNLFYLLCLKCLLLFCVYILSSGIIIHFIGNSNSNNVQTVFFYIAFVILLKPLEMYLKMFCRLEQKSLMYIMISFSQAFVYSISLILTLAFFNIGTLSVPISILLQTCVGVVWLLPVFLNRSSFRLNLSLVKDPLKYGYQVIIANYSNYLLQSGDRVILKLFCPLSLIGIYHTGYKIASIINFLMVTPVKFALNPIVFQQEVRPAEQKTFINRTASTYYLFILVGGLLIALFSKELVTILARQEQYHDVWVIIPLIIFGYLQGGLGNFLGLGMVMSKKSLHQSGILVVAVLVNICLNFVLIPNFNIIGAAVATAIAYIIWNYLKAIYSWKFYGLSFEYKKMHIISLIWVVFVSIGLLVSIPSLLFSIMFRLGLFCLFFTVIFTCGFMGKEEKNFIVELLTSKFFKNFRI